MKTIALTQGKVALVDDQDFDWLNSHNWYVYKKVRRDRVIWYAVRGEKDTTVYMHREILGFPPEVEHRDLDGLNSQRSNLGVAIGGQNQQNMPKRRGCISRFKGVAKNGKRWIAQIGHSGQNHYLGIFIEEAEAARVYDAAASRFFGAFARTNASLGLLP